MWSIAIEEKNGNRAVNLAEQIVPGTYEYTLTRLIDNKLDLSMSDSEYNNDYTDAA